MLHCVCRRNSWAGSPATGCRVFRSHAARSRRADCHLGRSPVRSGLTKKARRQCMPGDGPLWIPLGEGITGSSDTRRDMNKYTVFGGAKSRLIFGQGSVFRVHPTQGCAGLRPGIFGGITRVSNGTWDEYPICGMLVVPGETESGSAGTQPDTTLVSRVPDPGRGCAKGTSGPRPPMRLGAVLFVTPLETRAKPGKILRRSRIWANDMRLRTLQSDEPFFDWGYP